jgi:hypothetical protein
MRVRRPRSTPAISNEQRVNEAPFIRETASALARGGEGFFSCPGFVREVPVR